MQNNLNRHINTRINQHITSLSDDSGTAPHANNTAIKQKSHGKKQQKLKAIPDYVRTTHIERVACPLHIIELTKNLKKIEVSETLKIVVGGQAVESELLSACHSLGHKTIIIENEGHKELFVTRKQ